MALTVIAVVLVIVFFPILFGVASTALVIAFAVGMYVMGIGIICYAFFCAGKAATDPTLAKRAAVVALLVHLIAMLWLMIHRGGVLHYMFIIFRVLCNYGAAMMLIARARTFRSGKIKLGLLFMLAAPLIELVPLWDMPYFLTALRLLSNGLVLLGVVLLLMQPAHPDVPQQEKTGTLLVAGCVALDALFRIPGTFRSLAYVLQSEYEGTIMPYWSIPYSGYLLRGMEIAGLALFVLSIFNERKNRAQRR